MDERINLPASLHLQGSSEEYTTQAIAPTEEPKLCNDHMHTDSGHFDRETVNMEIPDDESLEYGCSHYRRRCRIRAPCCNEIFDCRHCHNEAKNDINVDPEERHTIPRHQIQQVICTLCGTEQEVRQMCVNCGVCMAKYFCGACKLFDDDVRPFFLFIFRCLEFPRDSTTVMDVVFAGCCYSNLLRESHPCVELAMHHDCPVCFEYLFDSIDDVAVMPCGHTIHKNCLKEMQQHMQYVCPLCYKSVCDMSKYWEKLDMEVAATPMPEFYHNKVIWILCNDCGSNSEVGYHVVGHKCPSCKSYNTRQTRG
ncbi:Rubredoxin-type fold [Cynara cardunculus var. scolymus]|uniref:Rubredoxin-type fold n=1 Tax=Cynara cardunculus var. scolymus TaxID=59895 RepID=A0A103XRS5_CYNCS|nr:Rubredoxin-type fold [Cynara cardunculus var. scolymus]